MNHLCQEDLVLHYYGEQPLEAAALAHLEACPACRADLAGLQQVLNSITTLAVPERGPGYAAEVWKRVSPAVARRRRTLFWQRPWVLAASAALLLVCAFVAGRRFERVEAPQVASVRERVLLVALGEHLERTQMMLIEFANSASLSEWSEEGPRAGDLVADNRLYRQTALQSGDRATALMLEELERTLLEIQHAPAAVQPGQFAMLQERLKERGVLFKVRVIESKVRQRQSEMFGGRRNGEL